SGDDAAPHGLPVAGQHPRAGERAGTRRHPGLGRHTGDRPRPASPFEPLPRQRATAEPGAVDARRHFGGSTRNRRQAATQPPGRGTQLHPHRPPTVGLGHYRPARRGAGPRPSPKHAAQPDEKTRHHECLATDLVTRVAVGTFNATDDDRLASTLFSPSGRFAFLSYCQCNTSEVTFCPHGTTSQCVIWPCTIRLELFAVTRYQLRTS